ncbi:uncharacterized protein LOC122088060 isoform X1 [Macadamia integrifolia]|uniref:uncharacterized protein LOC122088060 isoform X1 n=1 Tax=Macadamia integrifolia TaxID=60698 RepID=UPI001C4ED1A7|nr:uncharacterized protein LOC122088060 isoform X1 [Macadamia integrifolia]
MRFPLLHLHPSMRDERSQVRFLKNERSQDLFVGFVDRPKKGVFSRLFENSVRSNFCFAIPKQPKRPKDSTPSLSLPPALSISATLSSSMLSFSLQLSGLLIILQKQEKMWA